MPNKIGNWGKRELQKQKEEGKREENKFQRYYSQEILIEG